VGRCVVRFGLPRATPVGSRGLVTVQDEPHGVIDLKDCLTVKSADEKTGKPHSFEVATPDQVYFMFADSEAQKVGARGLITQVSLLLHACSHDFRTG
jgi:hypothetical protein